MHALLMPSPFEADAGHLIGRDPRDVSAAEFLHHLPDAATGLRAIRAKCLDCAHTASEVRKCVQHTCPLWPLRMGVKPLGLREARGESTEPRRGNPEALAAARAAR